MTTRARLAKWPPKRRLASSKFVILWLEDLLFGDAVSLGGFWSVTILVFALTFARKGVRLLMAPTVR